MALVTTVCAAAAPATVPDPQELEDRINALQAEVEQLEALQQAARQKQEADAATAATAAAVRADAQRRSRPLDLEEFTAGYSADRGFILRSADGRFLLHPFLVTQFRNVTNYREGAAPPGSASSTSPGGADAQNGFELRRVKFGVDGNAVSPDLTYQAIFSVDRKTGTVSLEDGWARYRFPDTPWAIRAGQIRDPLDHEQIVFAAFSLTADRSLVDDLFAGVDGLVQGVSIGYEDDGPFRAEAAFTDGLRSANTNFQDYPATGADWGAAARVEYKVRGDWKQYRDFTALGNAQPLLVFGAGADYTEAGRTAQFVHVVDAQYESPCGLGLYGAYLGRYVRHNAGPPGTNGAPIGAPTGAAPGAALAADTYDTTFRAQAGYVIDNRWEPFVRYEYIHFARAELPAGSTHSVVHEFTAGVNYYFAGHHAKLTTDITCLPTGSPVGDDGSGVLATRRGSELLLRAQFQLWL